MSELRDLPMWVGTSVSVAEWEAARRKVTLPPRLDDLLRPGTDLRPSTDLRPTPAILALQKWFDDDLANASPLGIAVLSGPHGTGKTVAAAWFALNRFAIQEPRFVTAAELSHLPRDERRDYFVHGLILDDLGAEHAEARMAWRADIDELVDTLYRNHDTAVITTNLPAAEFKARYGERVTDRIRECGTWIPVTGKSMRVGQR